MICNDFVFTILFSLLLRMCFLCVNCDDRNGYLIMEFKDFIKSRPHVQFMSKDYGSFDGLVNLDYTFVVSNQSEILKLDEETLNKIEKFYINECTEGTCTSGKIKTLMHKSNYIWFCIVTKIVNDGKEYIQDPSCKMHGKDLIARKPLANWLGTSYVSSDFQHNTVILEQDINVYSGYYSRTTKKLHIAYNVIPFLKSSVTDIHIAHLPKFYFKGDGAFLSAFLNDKSTYFVYHEADKSCSSNDLEKSQSQTRIVELCQNDKGTKNNLFIWSAKVDLECVWRENSDYNRHMPVTIMRYASDSVWLNDRKVLLVTFSDKGSAEPNSAVCAYTIDEIRAAFNSDMKKDDVKPMYLPNKYQNICSNQDINTLSEEDKSKIQTSSNLYPKRKAVLSATSLYYKRGARISKLFADEIPSFNQVNIYLGMSEGNSHSLIMLKKTRNKICVEKKIFINEEITMLKKAKTSDKVSNLYIGTKKRLIKLPENNCGRYSQKSDCLQDVYCGWRNNIVCVSLLGTNSVGIDSGGGKCSQAPTVASNDVLLWTDCEMLKLRNSEIGDNLGTCQCQVNSRGVVLKIGSCNVNGGWSHFSDWSKCNPSCGKGLQFKTRSCTFPKVQGGGKSCDPILGIESKSCINKEECKANKTSDTSFQLSQWTKWSGCNRKCGFSFSERSRQCLTAVLCNKELIQKRLCKNTDPCIETQISEWSDWVMKPNQRIRSRFNCSIKFFLFSNGIKLKMINTQTKVSECRGSCDQQYARSFIKSTFEPWSKWSNCSTTCGRSSQSFRHRTCRQFSSHSCIGSNYEIKLCNSLPCSSQWDCWTNWTPCPTLCETPGLQKRQRNCVLDKYKRACMGRSLEEKNCHLKECASFYTQWSQWSACLKDGYMKRERRCRTNRADKRKCLMPLIQTRPCTSLYNQGVVKYSSMYLVVASLLGFIIGGILGVSIGYIWFRCTVSVLNKSESIRLSTNTSHYRPGEQIDDSSIMYGSQYFHMIPVSTTPRQRSYTSSSPNTEVQNQMSEESCNTYNPSSTSREISQIPDPPPFYQTGLMTSPPSMNSPNAYFMCSASSKFDPQQGLYHVAPRSTSYQQNSHPPVPEEDDSYQ